MVTFLYTAWFRNGNTDDMNQKLLNLYLIPQHMYKQAKAKASLKGLKPLHDKSSCGLLVKPLTGFLEKGGSRPA